MNRYLAAGAAVAVALATLAVTDPFHLRYGGVYSAVLVTLAILLVTVLGVRLLRGRLARGVAGVLGALVAVGWLGLVWLAVEFAGREQVEQRIGPDGRVSLVLVRGQAFADPVYSVRLRAGSGPFAQESLVWLGLAEGAAPTGFRFADGDVVEVIAAEFCGYRSTYDPVTLDVEPVHRPLRLDGC